jgi:hypothetical protein
VQLDIRINRMCGIAGIINFQNYNLDNIVNSLFHRGPDNQSIYKDENVVFIHTRLSIQDIANGRNAISWDEKFDLDVWYVDNQSIWLDIKILWMTVKKVIMRDGISQNNHVTMDKFKGSL